MKASLVATAHAQLENLVKGYELSPGSTDSFIIWETSTSFGHVYKSSQVTCYVPELNRHVTINGLVQWGHFCPNCGGFTGAASCPDCGNDCTIAGINASGDLTYF